MQANWVWLLTGTGEPFGGTPQAVVPDATGPRPPRPAMDIKPVLQGQADLPVYASAEGGPSGMMVTYDPMDWLVRPEELLNVRDAFAVYVIGESMEPRYEQGDMILIHPTRPPKRGDDVLLLSAQEDGAFAALIKRLVKWDSQSWTLRQYNPDKEYELPRKDWQRAYVVIGRFNHR